MHIKSLLFLYNRNKIISGKKSDPRILFNLIASRKRHKWPVKVASLVLEHLR